MKNNFLALLKIRPLLVCLAGLFCVCGRSAAEEEKVLNIYNWASYIADDTISNFEKETGIKVNYDIFDTNEILYARLMARHTGYDIVVPSDNFASLQIKGGMLKVLDKSKLPNLVNMDPLTQAALAKLDPGNEHLVTWLWGYTTLGLNTKLVKAALGNLKLPDNIWELIFNPVYASKLSDCGISFMDSGNEVMPLALMYLGKNGFSENPDDYRAASLMLEKIRPTIRVFSTSSYTSDLANGELCVAMGYSGDINMARQRAIDANNGNDIVALIPDRGALFYFDTMAIPTDAPHPENALRWMNYIMRPEVHASLTNKVQYANPNLKSLPYVRKDIAENRTIFLSDEDKKKMVSPEPLTQLIRRIESRAFTKFKTGY